MDLPPWDEAERSGAPLPDPERSAAGGAAVRGPEGETILSAEDLASAAERLGREIPAPPAGKRHVLVLAGFPGDPAERHLLTWATVVKAALLLEPDPVHLVYTAVWARPTVFAGTAAELLQLRAAVERDEAGWKLFRRKSRPPFGRLRAVLVTAGELPEEERRFWAARGVSAS